MRKWSLGVSRDCRNFSVPPIISGTAKATNFQFCTHIPSIYLNKSPLQILGKVAVWNFSGHPFRIAYYFRCSTIPSLTMRVYLRLAAVASKTCQLAQNSVKIWTYSGSRSSKVDDFGTNRKGICKFLLVINSNFRPILHRFWDTVTSWLKMLNKGKCNNDYGVQNDESLHGHCTNVRSQKAW